jgi:hypothetical protein
VGHTIIGRLPKSERWRVVVDLLRGPTLDTRAIAGATVKAAESRLKELSGDPSLSYCFWLLVRMANAARGPDFVADVGRLGVQIQSNDTALAAIARVADQAQIELNRHPESGPFGELAALALRRALLETVGSEGRSLFSSSLEDLERAFRRHSSAAQFGELTKVFFGDFYARTLRFYVDRELSNSVGTGAALATVANADEFATALDRHARQSAAIVETFAAGWYSKRSWEREGAIPPEDAQRFVAHALTKLRKELLLDAQ